MTPTGIESNDQARLEVGREGLFSVYKDIDALGEREPQAKFDVVILWQVIEHLRTPWAEVSRLHSLLKPGGLVLISTPNADGLKAHILRSRWDNYRNPTHFYYFTSQSLQLTLRRAGFSKDLRWRSFISYPGHSLGRRMLAQLSARLGANGELFYVAQAPT
jgi:SAM-dependent methyltransferase